VRARYIAEGEQLLLDIIPAPPNIAAHDVRELSADEAIASNLQIGNFAALITIITHGKTLGADSRDEYSLLGKPVQMGTQITAEAKGKCRMSRSRPSGRIRD
jgi:hypothetical protein